MESVQEEDLLECRESFETQAALWACERHTDEDVAQMRSLIDELSEDSTIDDVVRIDLGFHAAIARASHNEVVLIINGVLHRVIWKKLMLAYEARSAKEKKEMIRSIDSNHRDIFESIVNNDPSSCRTAMENHMRKFQIDILT